MKTRPISDRGDLTRREFMKAAGVTLGAAALVCAGAGCSDASAGQDKAQSVEIETPSYSYGDDTLPDPRILIAYATRTGSTTGVAAAIGEVISERGFIVDVKPILENPSIEGYQSVLIGSAVNGGQWLPEAVEFVKNNQPALSKLPTALFCVHIMNLGDDEKSKKNRLAYLDKLRSLIQPVDEAFFAGMGMNPDEQPGLIRWFYRKFNIGPEGDCRDWDQIDSWAEAVPI